MALSGLDIYKLLPKTNCRQCGFPTCLAFAMQLAAKKASLDKCPFVSDQVKAALESASQPPIKLVVIGNKEKNISIGNETVMFRHEEKFYHPCGIGFLIEDTLSEQELTERVERINRLDFERVGQKISVDLIALKQSSLEKGKFIQSLKKISSLTNLNFVLMSSDIASLREALQLTAANKPLIYAADKNNYTEFAKLSKEFSTPLAIRAENLTQASELTSKINGLGVSELVLDVGDTSLTNKIADFTQIRRLSLKKQDRSLGFPTIAFIDEKDTYDEIAKASTFMAKYASIIIIKSVNPCEVLPLLTLRQNLYADPQKPLQVEAKASPVGSVKGNSPVLVTTNFSLTYYTVLGEVEASKVPSYIITVDTEGMSVLTAWAAEKFTAEKIAETVNKTGIKEKVDLKKIIIPGYVAVLSGDLQEQTGLEVLVGPKEAAGIPSFLKNL